ncbi:MAG: hypothetical protein EI684_17050 [Candidatus Viridilinea halotolerans]|uniref:Uncharacterized protein n=1 Tax=Candidatus Viridilinea halotolerans TaxID=2491704 RepID=A0A426TUF9_9CHLR|nr:MAG: hypothetical protein EI684_17050 [Candidatus Viridilinea halotolerans]
MPFATYQRLDLAVGDGAVREHMGQQELPSLDLEDWTLAPAIKTDLFKQAKIIIYWLTIDQRQITPAIATFATNLEALQRGLPGEGTASGGKDIPDKKDWFTRINGMRSKKLHLVQQAACR